MNYSILAIIVLITTVVFFFFRNKKTVINPEPKDFSGSLKDISALIEEYNAVFNGGVLIIDIKKDIFVQFSSHENIIQMDFPLTTEIQLSLKEKIEDFGKNNKLELIVNKGTDESLFYDFDLIGTTEEQVKYINAALKEIFDVDEDTKLSFRMFFRR